ncbi:PiggyBac transposable element-derived protein 4 [Oopsacas minuta]|nr:PiggyBac transposable element-derived protein 4 [Oopsacas minuta]
MTNSKLMEHLDRNGDKLKSHKYLDAFIPEELNALLGLLILTGVFHANKESIADLFSDDINKSKPIFKATMPRDRLKHMLKFLRFDDASTRDERKQSDRLAPIRDVFESLNRLFREYYTPGTWVTVDEHLARYRGKCSFKQYIPSKPDRYGIKIWVIADSKNYYPLILEIYIGKTNLSNKPEDIVLRLACVLNPGHIIVGDSYFTSLSLTNKLLKQHQIGYLGTIKKMRVEIPRSLHVTKTRELYSSIFLFTDKHILLSYIAKKNKNVFLLTNVHTSKALSEYKNKALIILDYNKSKSGVDKLDQLIKEYRSYRATARWPCVVFYDLIGFSTHAAWVLYCLKFPESKMVKTKNRKEFLYILGQQLVNPLIVIRKNSSKFKYYHSVIKTAITQVSSSIPTDRSISENFSEQSPDILDVSESESYVLGVETIAKANPSQGDIDIDTDTDSINSNEPISKLVTKGKRGRCNQCVRKNVDLKVTASCRICGLFVCSKHSKNIVFAQTVKTPLSSS